MFIFMDISSHFSKRQRMPRWFCATEEWYYCTPAWAEWRSVLKALGEQSVIIAGTAEMQL